MECSRIFDGFSMDVSWTFHGLNSSLLNLKIPQQLELASFRPCWLVDLLGWQNGPVALGCCGGSTTSQ